MKLSCTLLFLFLSLNLFAKEQIIYSVGHELPMENTDAPTLKKNYYITAGSEQGIKKGAVLDVFRVISQQNHYNKQSRVNYKVKIGQIRIIETTDEASIGISQKFDRSAEAPILEVKNFMIGDLVAIQVDD